MCLQNYEKYGKQQPLHTVKMQPRPTPTPQAARRPRGGRHVQAVAHIDATLAPRPQFTMPSGSTRHDAALHNTANALALNALQYGPF